MRRCNIQQKSVFFSNRLAIGATEQELRPSDFMKTNRDREKLRVKKIMEDHGQNTSGKIKKRKYEKPELIILGDMKRVEEMPSLITDTLFVSGSAALD
jgi:hypothetical protein